MFLQALHAKPMPSRKQCSRRPAQESLRNKRTKLLFLPSFWDKLTSKHWHVVHVCACARDLQKLYKHVLMCFSIFLFLVEGGREKGREREENKSNNHIEIDDIVTQKTSKDLKKCFNGDRPLGRKTSHWGRFKTQELSSCLISLEMQKSERNLMETLSMPGLTDLHSGVTKAYAASLCLCQCPAKLTSKL